MRGGKERSRWMVRAKGGRRTNFEQSIFGEVNPQYEDLNRQHTFENEGEVH